MIWLQHDTQNHPAKQQSSQTFSILLTGFELHKGNYHFHTSDPYCTNTSPELSVQQTPFLARWSEMRSAQPMRCLWWKSIFWSKLLVHVEDRMQNVWPQLFRTSPKLLVNPKMGWAEEHNNGSINLSEMAGLELNVGCLFVDRRVEKDTFRNHHLPHCKVQHHVKACPRNNPTFMYTHHLHQRIEGIQNSSSASMILSKSSPPVQSSMTK